jgi:putative protease
MKNKIELLAPAGDIERGKIAINFGADAIYLGAQLFSLRSRASNFTYKNLHEICKLVHKQKKRIYLVTNIFCHNNDTNEFENFIKKIKNFGIDAYICSDPFIIELIKKNITNAEIHISTQQTISNSKAALFFKRNGASRIVFSRETTFSELKETIANVKNKIELEIFIHGAVCIAFSGRCMLSNNFCYRDANTGGCAQSCR